MAGDGAPQADLTNFNSGALNSGVSRPPLHPPPPTRNPQTRPPSTQFSYRSRLPNNCYQSPTTE
eukprot:scaffold1817_cov111-Skeletonema_dohrnii-CCMP3373.AAC.2